MDQSAPRAWITKGLDAKALAALARELPATELWSLLLSVAEQRAVARKPSALSQQYAQDRFVQPSAVSARDLLELDTHLFANAESFEAIELSPVAPLGVCSVIAPTSQNRVVATMRGTEVVSDPTNILALESARLLRADPTAVVKFATSHRCVRAQAVPKLPGFTAHFRMFCLTSAAHEAKDQAFTRDACVEHIQVHLGALDRLERHGYRFSGRTVRLLSTPERTPLAENIATKLRATRIEVVHEPLTKEYYDGLRFMISAGPLAGSPIPLIDGGAFDWVGKLAANRKLVFVASAIGSQLVVNSFRSDPHA